MFLVKWRKDRRKEDYVILEWKSRKEERGSRGVREEDGGGGRKRRKRR